MKIWVDADACPVVIKEILFRAAERTGVELTLVANQPMNRPTAPNITTIQVAQGFDMADNEIVKRLAEGDLVITSDIPLAAEVIEKGGHALSPRGEMHTTENIGARRLSTLAERVLEEVSFEAPEMAGVQLKIRWRLGVFCGVDPPYGPSI